MCCKLDDVNFFHLLYYEIIAIVCVLFFSVVIFLMLSFMFILLFFLSFLMFFKSQHLQWARKVIHRVSRAAVIIGVHPVLLQRIRGREKLMSPRKRGRRGWGFLPIGIPIVKLQMSGDRMMSVGAMMSIKLMRRIRRSTSSNPLQCGAILQSGWTLSKPSPKVS
jgi:hypothetical protein